MNAIAGFNAADPLTLLGANVLAQILLVVLLAWALARTVRGHDPAIRHGIWVCACSACWPVRWLHGSWIPPASRWLRFPWPPPSSRRPPRTRDAGRCRGSSIPAGRQATRTRRQPVWTGCDSGGPGSSLPASASRATGSTGTAKSAETPAMRSHRGPARAHRATSAARSGSEPRWGSPAWLACGRRVSLGPTDLRLPGDPKLAARVELGGAAVAGRDPPRRLPDPGRRSPAAGGPDPGHRGAAYDGRAASGGRAARGPGSTPQPPAVATCWCTSFLMRCGGTRSSGCCSGWPRCCSGRTRWSTCSTASWPRRARNCATTSCFARRMPRTTPKPWC